MAQSHSVEVGIQAPIILAHQVGKESHHLKVPNFLRDKPEREVIHGVDKEGKERTESGRPVAVHDKKYTTVVQFKHFKQCLKRSSVCNVCMKRSNIE
ncbi:hypothetical protein ANCCAN_02982 [Ancylostoma caninum]|uniref:Uncharacterized protein n=1 Tax=Ancylostoma caninum TaxID=29170 RepID=A0A368H5Q4_ANCCA|nr:hypothetical protein ANCCAN_02982 [Ancylostoma caninum]